MLHREFVYIWYYFEIQLRQIFPYWVLGMVLGSAVSVFAKEKIHDAVRALSGRKLGACRFRLFPLRTPADTGCPG